MSTPDPARPALVSVAWLAARLAAGDRQVKPVDASWYLPAAAPAGGRDGRAEFARAHIPGAVHFDIDVIADRQSGLPHTLPAPAAFAAAVGALGIGNDDHVVAYDGAGIFSAPRVWWMFRVFGHARVSVLDGGLPAWQAAGQRLDSGPPAIAASRYRAPAPNGHIVRLDHVRYCVETAAEHILDARDPGRFAGAVPEPRPNVRGGHMPGAVNLPYPALLHHAGQRMLPTEALRQKFAAAGVQPAQPVIASCGSGVTAAILALGLDLTGHRNWAVYDGSWSEWGGRADTPVVTGP